MAPAALRSTLARTDPRAHPAGASVDHGGGRTGCDRETQLEQQVHGLTEALHNRDVIGQAKGILIAHNALDDGAAFALLVRLSQHTNVKFAQISAALVTRVRNHGPAAPPHRHCQHCRLLDVALGELRERRAVPGESGPSDSR